MWRSKRKSPVIVPDDTGQAKAIRAEAERELVELAEQAGEVESVARKLERLRRQDNFGTDLSITFRPRGGYS